MNPEHDPEKIFAQTLEDFRQGVSLHKEFELRVARRVTVVVRGGMISLGVVAVVLFMLIFMLTIQMKNMLLTVHTMRDNFTIMTKSMEEMTTNVHEMSRSVNAMPAIVEEVRIMQHSVAGLGDDMQKITDRMNAITASMEYITDGTQNMAQTFGAMNDAVLRMGIDVNRIARPVSRMGGMMP